MRYLYRLIGLTCILLALPFVCKAQIRELEVRDFYGGWVSGLENAVVKNNQAIVLSNFDLRDGGLKRRKGMSAHYNDAQSNTPVNAAFPYYGSYDKDMLLRRSGNAYYPDSFMVDVVSLCNDALEVCTTQIYQIFYRREHDLTMPFNTDYSTWARRLLMASTKSELMLWDGDSIFPARPIAPGQPKVVAIDGGRELNGIYNYKYWAVDSSGIDTSFFSPPSWDVHVNHGRVAVIIPPRVTLSQEYWEVFRKAESETDYYYVGGGITSASEMYFIDSISDGDRGAAAQFTFGSVNDCNHGSTRCDMLRAPGGMLIDTSETGGQFPFDNNESDSISSPVWVLYAITYVDSIGRESYMSTPTGRQIYGTPTAGSNCDSCNMDFKITLTNIPVPDDANISHKLLRRRLYGIYRGTAPDSIFKSWYTVDSLSPATTTYTDSLPYGTVVEWCSSGEGQLSTSISGEYTCYDDSTIDFTPSSIVEHGSRLYAIGDPRYPDYLYYSEFGRPTTWDPAKFISVPSQKGDWFVKLLSLSNDRLLLFRQNSVVALEGLSYYQYSIDNIITGVGLTAPATALLHRNQVFFAHRTGLYRLGGEQALSVSIRATIDSVGSKIQRSVGAIVDNEYWWSVAVVAEENDRTLIYSDDPVPHWRTYDFGTRGVVQFDSDSTEADFRTDKYIILRDSLWEWGYQETDTTDGGTPIQAIYQSKYFFEGGGREMIEYVELEGKGTPDSLILYYYEKHGDSLPPMPVDSIVVTPDFTDKTRDRYKIERVCYNFSLRIRDPGTGDWVLTGYKIGWQPWDGGKR